MTKVRWKAPGTNVKGDRVRGQRGYKCAHGVERQTKSRDEKRPFQRVKFTGCPAKDGAFSHKIDYVLIFFLEILNLKVHLNCPIGLKVTMNGGFYTAGLSPLYSG